MQKNKRTISNYLHVGVLDRRRNLAGSTKHTKGQMQMCRLKT